MAPVPSLRRRSELVAYAIGLHPRVQVVPSSECSVTDWNRSPDPCEASTTGARFESTHPVQ